MKESGRNKLKKISFFINLIIRVFSIFPNSINTFLFTIFRNTTGNIGLLLRYVLVKNLAKKCGDNVSIQPNVYLYNIQEISFGTNVSVHSMCYLEGEGGIEIGDNVSIAHASTVMSTSHSWDNIEIPIKYNRKTFGKVTIKGDVWIGAGARILSGINIESRSIIAAGAVVNKNVDSNCIIGGVPGIVIKKI